VNRWLLPLQGADLVIIRAFTGCIKPIIKNNSALDRSKAIFTLSVNNNIPLRALGARRYDLIQIKADGCAGI